MHLPTSYMITLLHTLPQITATVDFVKLDREGLVGLHSQSDAASLTDLLPLLERFLDEQ